MTLVAKSELKYFGPLGLTLWLCGLIFIDRNSKKTAFTTINDALMKLKVEHTHLWVYPEGRVYNTGEIHEFKKGAFYAAINAQVPIVPVVFSCYKGFVDSEKKIFNSGEIIIEALPELTTEGLTADDVDDLIAKTRSLMVAKYKQLNNELSHTS